MEDQQNSEPQVSQEQFEAIEKAAAAADFGRPSAQKRGRDPKWPYVPVILRDSTRGPNRQEQIRGLAYATRDEAVAMAERTIECRRSSLRERLGDRRHRALREQHGLPREI